MMQSYLAIGIKNSMDIEYLKEKFNKSLELTSPINPSNMTINLWQSSNHKLVLFQWTNESHSNLWNEANKVVTLSGYTNNEGYDLAKKLYSEEYYSHENIINNLSGQFSILFMDGKENIIQGFNSITRTEPIYYADNEDYVVIGNKAIMVHLMVSSGMLPEYDFSTFGSFLNTGYFNDENTPYKYVNLLRPGSSVIFKNNNINVKDYINVDSKLDESELNSAYYDDLASIFIDSFKPLNHHNVTINSGLTGGKDSRLIAAALTFLGKDFKTHTTGFEEHPDVVLAKRIADTLGIEHEVNLPNMKNDTQDIIVHDILNRAINTLLVTDGMLSAYENVPLGMNFNQKVVSLGGNGGEHLRGGFNRNVSRHDVKGLNQLLFQVLNPFSMFINSEIQNNYEEHLTEWMNKSEDDSAKDIMMKYYIYYRTGKWSSVARSGYTLNNHLYQPFFDARLVREVLRIPAEYLINDKVIYEILLRLSPQLVDIPFFADRWNFEKEGPIDGDVAKWEKRTPLIANNQSKGGFNWRRTTLKDLKEPMFEEILSSQNQNILNLVNESEVKNLFETSMSNNREIDMFVWNLYTTTILSSNDWLENRERSKVVEIQLPPTKLVSNLEFNIENNNLGLKNTDNNGKVRIEDNSIIYHLTNDNTNTNKYIYTFEGNFTTPPNINKYKLSEVPKAVRLTTINFAAKAEEPQSLLVFFMGYDQEKRIFNESRRVNLLGDMKNYSLSYEHTESLSSYKIAIKTINKKDNSTNTWIISDLNINFYG